MSTPQKRALLNYRNRLSERGLARFEVLGLSDDRDFLRSLARWLAENSAEATSVRASVSQIVSGQQPPRGGILAALRRSPLVGSDIDLTREKVQAREIDF